LLPFLLWIGTLSGQVAFPFIFTESRPRGESTLQIVNAGVKHPVVPGFAASANASVSFDGKRLIFSGKRHPADVWQIWEITLAGGAPHRLSSGAGDAIAPFYLPADKYVYSRRTPEGFEIEVAPLDGSTPPLRLTYGPGDHIVNEVLRDGRILFEAPHTGRRDLYTVYSDGSGVETHRCDHSHDRHSGRELASGDIVFEAGGRLARFTSARAVEIGINLPAGQFDGPIAEIADDDWLVSYRPAKTGPFGLYRLNPNLEKVLVVDGADARDPVIVRPQTAPKWHPSSLGNREGGNILCLNVYTSHLPIPPGAVAQVRVWARSDRDAEIRLGEAPVESDGSFFLTVPSERAIRFELLDRNGKTAAAEKTWFWMRRGEQRVCVGCHAGPERAPDNEVPQILLRTTDPVKMEFPK